MTNRRQFMQYSSLVGLGSSVPTFLARTAQAAPDAAKPGAKDTILVVVQLTGGNDGLNTVIPFKDETYAKYRPTIKVPEDRVKKLNDHIGLHPTMDGLAGLYEDKALAVIQAVGYPNPSQSHFRSMDIWHAASTADSLTEGWIGKALKTMNCPAFHVAGGNESAPLALTGAPARVPSITNLADFQLKLSDQAGQRDIVRKSAMPSTNTGSQTGLLDFVQRTASNTYDSSKKLQELSGNYQPKVPYPQTGLANRLKVCAQLIDAGLGSRLFYVSIDGFDTHASQGGPQGSHANLLTEVSGAITAFYKDMAARGHKDRLMVMTFSEFGRRAKENGSKGTDHGSGAPMFLVGGKVNAGVHGKHPDLNDLDMGNLKFTTDFRQVYTGILDQWLGVPSKDIVGEGQKAFKVMV
ncbi:DUF1501 domain-containing protein [Zavarzinella formosa]|uniref:DUF1501 domain-containing protein n=1 Tax=Zavarzinella formosa TaxID=360055 RepID=UPI0002F46D6C|nr:DUF1501 domain-containing protein [Zavarzinella formosa]